MNEELNVEVVDVVETMSNNSPIDVETFDESKVDPKMIALCATGTLLAGGIALLIAKRHKIKNWINEKRIKKLYAYKLICR